MSKYKTKVEISIGGVKYAKGAILEEADLVDKKKYLLAIQAVKEIGLDDKPRLEEKAEEKSSAVKANEETITKVSGIVNTVKNLITKKS